MMHRNRHRRRTVPQIVRLIWRGVQAIAKALIYLAVEFTAISPLVEERSR